MKEGPNGRTRETSIKLFQDGTPIADIARQLNRSIKRIREALASAPGIVLPNGNERTLDPLREKLQADLCEAVEDPSLLPAGMTCPRCKWYRSGADFINKFGRIAKGCAACREQDRIRMSTSEKVAWRASYEKTERGKALRAALRTRYELRNKIKHNAHLQVLAAIGKGTLARMPCEMCGEKAEAHHDDYAKVLNVRWLCRYHHRKWHKNNKALNG